MNAIDNMELFVRVVKAKGLAAAGRQVGLSPASMTARMNALEKHYDTRLLHRTTRRISLTDAGRRFYDACLRVLAEVEQAEALLKSDDRFLSGPLSITAPHDFGRQFVAPALSDFVALHPKVVPSLHLSDGIANLIEHGFDLAVRFGNLPDSSLIAKRLADNQRLLIAAPDYLQARGIPDHPGELAQHNCLVMDRLGEPLNEWQFQKDKERFMVEVRPAMKSNDGAIIRDWALAGKGIACKSIWDVQHDLLAGRLQTVLEDFALGFQPTDSEKTGLHLVYPNRKYLPVQVREFIRFFQKKLAKKNQLQP